MARQRCYFVVGPDNMISWNDKTESGESFPTVEKAQKRAVELAELDPGKEFLVCEAAQIVCCPVGRPIVTSA